MLSFTAEEMAGAFVAGGFISMPIAGKMHQVPFTTEGYERIRREFIKANPKPKPEAVGEKVIHRDSPEAKILGISQNAVLKVYEDDLSEFQYRVGEWTADLGRRLAAHCLQVELLAVDGTPMTEAQRLAFYQEHMTGIQAVQVVNEIQERLRFQVQDAADFSVGPSASNGESGNPSPPTDPQDFGT